MKASDIGTASDMPVDFSTPTVNQQTVDPTCNRLRPPFANGNTTSVLLPRVVDELLWGLNPKPVRGIEPPRSPAYKAGALPLCYTGMKMNRVIVSGGSNPVSLEELTDSFLLAASFYSVVKQALPPAPFQERRTLSETGRDCYVLAVPRFASGRIVST